MKRGIVLAALCVLFAVPALAAVITLNPDDENNSYGYMHTRVLEDANGNIHILTKLDSDVEGGWGTDDMLYGTLADALTIVTSGDDDDSDDDTGDDDAGGDDDSGDDDASDGGDDDDDDGGCCGC